MTYKEFLAALKKTPREWRIEYAPMGPIRCSSGCPIQVLGGPVKFLSAAIGKLKLKEGVANRIIWGADGWRTHKRTRRDLLKACGLKERT